MNWTDFLLQPLYQNITRHLESNLKSDYLALLRSLKIQATNPIIFSQFIGTSPVINAVSCKGKI